MTSCVSRPPWPGGRSPARLGAAEALMPKQRPPEFNPSARSRSIVPGTPSCGLRAAPPDSAPDVTVTRNAHSPGELLLDVIAARILTTRRSSRRTTPDSRPPPMPACVRLSPTGPSHVVAAPHAAGTLPPDSPVPGHLAGLCARPGINGHGISATAVTWRCTCAADGTGVRSASPSTGSRRSEGIRRCPQSARLTWPRPANPPTRSAPPAECVHQRLACGRVAQ